MANLTIVLDFRKSVFPRISSNMKRVDGVSELNPSSAICFSNFSIISLTTGLPYNRVPITVIGGQSLAFTAGSYLTIAFHSTGSSNTFVCSPLGVVSAGLCYTTIANYSTTTFPATITNSAISVIPSVRVCFDLY